MDDFGIQFGVAGEETEFNCNEEDLINFVTEGITILFGEINEVLLPKSIGVFETHHNGD